MEKTPFSSDSNAKLSEAIRKLEDYSLQQLTSDEKSSVSKTIGLVRSILISPFDTRLKKHNHQRLPPNKNEVLIAVEFINRNRLFIEKLKEGTPAEQELAEKYTKTINNYNESCDKRIQGCIADKSRIANFFSKDKQKEQILPRIALIKKVTVQHNYPEYSPSKAMHKLYSNNDIKMHIPKQSAELFHMKTIALLERYGLASCLEARKFVKQSPIYTTIEKNTSICTMTQKLSLFPGQTIIVKGNSTLDPNTETISRFLPESFCLSMELTQTGFPHPTQRAGWTVSPQLIPDTPQRIDLLDKTAKLLQKRNQAVAELLQEGDLLKHAKALLSIKKKSFEEHAEELIKLQEILAMTILQTASAETEAYHTVRRFFHSLRTHPHSFEALVDVSQAIREYFMIKPHQMLLDAIIKGKTTNLGSADPELRYEAAKMILNQAIDTACKEFEPKQHDVENIEERHKLEYVGCMGNLIGKASIPIFLQYLSEDLVFEPPSLSPFECKVQAVAYLHLKDFLDELTIPLDDNKDKNQETVYQLLKKQICSDIDLFRDEHVLEISEELADYYQNRYLSLSSL